MPERTYSMEEFEQASGVGTRTLRHWMNERLLPGPTGRGRAARYGDRHVLLARVIHELRKSQRSLRAVRSRIAALDDAQLRALLPAPARVHAEDGVPPPPEPPSYPATTWEMVQLMDGLALLVSSHRGPAVRRIADDIYKHYALRT